MKIVVTGGSGQLGKTFKKISQNSEHEFIFCNSKDLDITNKNKLEVFFKINDVDFIINCAAYTAVDKAEDEKEKAFLVNDKGVEYLIEICEKHKIKLIHFSTDYVFNGQHFRPYVEKDVVNPLGVYGQSKLAGEELILQSEVSALIFRTSWLYALYGHNFVNTMLKLGKANEEISVVQDQIGSPTSTMDLAKACLACIEKQHLWSGKREIYHFSNEGVASWYDFALAIFEINNISCEINPILSKDFPTKAKRPYYSVLNKTKIKSDFGIKIPHWRSALEELKI